MSASQRRIVVRVYPVPLSAVERVAILHASAFQAKARHERGFWLSGRRLRPLGALSTCGKTGVEGLAFPVARDQNGNVVPIEPLLLSMTKLLFTFP